MRKSAQVMAFSGMFAALAVVVMSLGGLIPIATYVCPVVCSVILYMVMSFCGKRTGWVWFVCVSMLSLLLGPDKEAGAVFLALGYYPLLKPRFDSLPAKWLFKLAFFNLVSGVLYAVLLFVMGMEHLLQEWNEIGIIGLLIALALGNLCFILLDIALARFSAKNR
jgi:hypothetical protein